MERHIIDSTIERIEMENQMVYHFACDDGSRWEYVPIDNEVYQTCPPVFDLEEMINNS